MSIKSGVTVCVIVYISMPVNDYVVSKASMKKRLFAQSQHLDFLQRIGVSAMSQFIIVFEMRSLRDREKCGRCWQSRWN